MLAAALPPPAEAPQGAGLSFPWPLSGVYWQACSRELTPARPPAHFTLTPSLLSTGWSPICPPCPILSCGNRPPSYSKGLVRVILWTLFYPSVSVLSAPLFSSLHSLQTVNQWQCAQSKMTEKIILLIINYNDSLLFFAHWPLLYYKYDIPFLKDFSSVARNSNMY